MAAKILRSLAVSAFCEDMAMMLAAGIQVDDALSLMRGDSGDGPLYDAASAVLERVQMGEPLAEAVEQCGYFPAYAAQLVAAGEAAGRTESVLKSLAVYYETQDKLEKRLKSAVIYPAVLLFLMAGVLAVLVARVLPVFTGVYTGLAGSVAASSYAYITAANIIGWASLCLVIVLTALLLTGAAAARTQRGNGLFRTLFGKTALYFCCCPAAGGGAIYYGAGHVYGQRDGHRHSNGTRVGHGAAPRAARAAGKLPPADA